MELSAFPVATFGGSSESLFKFKLRSSYSSACQELGEVNLSFQAPHFKRQQHFAYRYVATVERGYRHTSSSHQYLIGYGVTKVNLTMLYTSSYP